MNVERNSRFRCKLKKSFNYYVLYSWLPESPAPLLNLCQETESVWSQQRGRGPIVVHCQSGVGRSGVLVILTLLLNELRSSHHLPEVLTASALLAKYRKNPLRDRSHLSFVYHCLLYHARDILMKSKLWLIKSAWSLNMLCSVSSYCLYFYILVLRRILIIFFKFSRRHSS